MSIKWIEHKGRHILYSDYRGLSPQQMLEQLELAAQMLEAAPGQSLTLVNYEGVSATREYMNRVKQLGQEVFARKTAKQAILGITGIKVVFHYAYMRARGEGVALFRTEAEALEWLVMEANGDDKHAVSGGAGSRNGNHGAKGRR